VIFSIIGWNFTVNRNRTIEIGFHNLCWLKFRNKPDEWILFYWIDHLSSLIFRDNSFSSLQSLFSWSICIYLWTNYHPSFSHFPVLIRFQGQKQFHISIPFTLIFALLAFILFYFIFTFVFALMLIFIRHFLDFWSYIFIHLPTAGFKIIIPISRQIHSLIHIHIYIYIHISFYFYIQIHKIIHIDLSWAILFTFWFSKLSRVE
jgi:hypothetical protein